MNLSIKNSLISILVIVAILIFPLLVYSAGSLSTENLVFEDALEWGLRHSPAMQKLNDNIKSTERMLVRIKAILGWQLGLQSTGSYGKYPLNLRSSDDPEGQVEIALVGSKSFLWGLNLQPKITLTEKGEFTFTDLEDKVNFNLAITQTLFPRITTQPEQEYYATEISLKKLQNSLAEQQNQKLIDWLEKYLILLGLQQQMEIETQNLKSAQTNLANILREEQFGEAGKQKVLEAEINEKRTQYRTMQAEQNFQQQKQSWYQELGFNPGQEVIFNLKTEYLQGLISKIENYSLDLSNISNLMEKILTTNPEIKANLLDQNLTMKKLAWSRTKALPQLTFRGNYEHQSELWSLGLNLTYDIFDGGTRRIEKLDQQEQLHSLQREYQRLMKELQLKLENYINQYNLDKLTYEEKSLSLEKAIIEESSTLKQYKAGLITEREYSQKNTAKLQAERDFQAAYDKVLVSKLRLLHFLGLENELLGGKTN